MNEVNIDKLIVLLVVMLVGIGFILTIGTPIAYYCSECTTIVTINDKERTSGNDGVWLIFTDNEVFKTDDSILYFHFTSSDLYGKLKVGKKYKVKVIGWRIPLFSMYRNIIEAEKQ